MKKIFHKVKKSTRHFEVSSFIFFLLILIVPFTLIAMSYQQELRTHAQVATGTDVLTDNCGYEGPLSVFLTCNGTTGTVGTTGIIGTTGTTGVIGGVGVPTCEDGIDNNGNGLIDSQDPTCHTDGNPSNYSTYNPNGTEGATTGQTTVTATTSYTGGAQCGYNVYQQILYCPTSYSCSNQATNQCTSSTTSTVANCADGIDNNGNGLIDSQDPACHTDGNPSNIYSYNPNGSEGTTGSTTCDPVTLSTTGQCVPVNQTAQPCVYVGNVCLTPTPTLSPTPTESLTPTETPTPTVTPTGEPTITPTFGATALSLTVALHGIGSGGDNSNPVNKNNGSTPIHTTRQVNVDVIDANNDVVATLSGTLTYAGGKFTGDIPIYSSALIPGEGYLVRISIANYLHRLIPAIQLLTPGQKNTISTDLVAGDANNDNSLTILDYNLLINCFSDLKPATACTPGEKLQTDFNDDGVVNEIDYNLFLRELSSQAGNQ